MTTLLEPEVIRELEVLRRYAKSRARSRASGERTSKRRGTSAEFRDHRAYTPGDDPRRIDWAAFARTGEPVVKLFAADEDVIVRLVVDASASVACGGDDKLVSLRRAAAAVAYLALAASERAQVVVAGTGIRRAHEPARGRASMPKVFSTLAGLEAEGGTDLARAIEDTVSRGRTPGVLCVVSDFFDEGPWDHALSRARAAGHDVRILQVLGSEELDPPMEGDYELEDAETGEVVRVSVDADAIETYRAEVERLFSRLEAVARRTGGRYVRTSAAEPVPAALRRMLAGEVRA